MPFSSLRLLQSLLRRTAVKSLESADSGWPRAQRWRGAGQRLSLLACPVLVASLALVAAWMSNVSAVASPPKQTSPDLSAYPWLYLRDGRPLAEGERVVQIVATGDVMPGRDVAMQVQPLADIAPLLRSGDLTVGNLECVIADSGSARPGPYRLRARPGAAEELRQAGFDLLGLANNHALDYGSAALAETISRLGQAGLATMGAGLEPESAARPVFRDIGGLRLAFVAFSTVPDPEADTADRGCTPALSKLDEAVATVAAARAQADAVIVSVHWGYEYELAPDPSQRRAAQALLDAGADLVVGHHPHVVQGTEIRYGQGNDRDRFVAFSLGNLLFDQEQGESRQGLVLTTLFDRYGLRAVQALPIRAGPHPQLVAVADAAATLARIQPPARRIGFACHASSAPGGSEACRPVEVPQTPGKGCFTFGETDLTGDGLPEQVQIEREQVSVFHEGVEVWRGLAGWRVVDLALGDANDDGRSEMLLALYKADDDGLVHSHPFLIGYREGAYRILWGGSAVADPLQEVELGDVDGDGVQELIVLEKQGGSQALTVWRWHGWGFSLEWRSSPGHYRDLALLPQSGAPPLITVGLSPN